MQLLYFCNHVYPQYCRCYKITRNFRCSSITLCPLGRQQQREQDWLYSSQETSSFKNFLALGGLSRAGAASLSTLTGSIHIGFYGTWQDLHDFKSCLHAHHCKSCWSLISFFFLGRCSSMSFTERALQLFFWSWWSKKSCSSAKGSVKKDEVREKKDFCCRVGVVLIFFCYYNSASSLIASGLG